MQTGDFDAELAHEGHVVLDHDDGVLAIDLLEQFRRLLRLHVGHAGDRFVDQQQFRILRQQHADFEPLLLAMRQAAGKAVLHGRETDDLQDLVDPVALVRCFPRPQRRARTAIGFERKFEIVVDGVAVEHGRLLEFAADAKLGDLGLVEPGQIVELVENHRALVRPGFARDHVHHGRLAGAVRTDNGAHLAGRDGEGKIIERAKPVERHRDALDIEKRSLERLHRLVFGLRQSFLNFHRPILIPPAAARAAARQRPPPPRRISGRGVARSNDAGCR